MAAVTAVPSHGRAHRSRTSGGPPAGPACLTEDEIALYDLHHQPGRHSQFLPQKRWERISPAFSQPDARAVLNDKWIFSRYVADLGVAVPRTYGLFHPQYGVSDRLAPLRTPADLVRIAHEVGDTGLVAKPVRGLQGKAVVVVTAVEWQAGRPAFVLADGDVLDADGLAERLTVRVRRGEGFVLQERCLPHPWADQVLPPTTVLRLVTFVPNGADPVVQVAALFAGRAGHAIWSWKNGGVTIGVDVPSGTLQRGRTLPQFGTSWLSHHPDTGRSFVGRQVPHWPEVRQMVTTAARGTPGVRLAAWEVLLTPRGPRLLEGNLLFGLHTVQVHTQGFLAEDGIAQQWRQVHPTLTGRRPRRRPPTPPAVANSRPWSRLGGRALRRLRPRTR